MVKNTSVLNLAMLAADQPAPSASLDLLFVLDATGSMGPVINSVKHHIKDLVGRIQSSRRNTHVRLGVVAYRDYEDDVVSEAFGFTSDVGAFQKYLHKLQATGGDDDAEDVLTGWEEACGMDWQSDARMIVHFADAPCHGREYHDDDVRDHYLDGDKKGRTTTQLLKTLAETCRVNTFQFMHLNESTFKMLRVVQKKYPREEWYQEEHISALQEMTERIFKGSLSSIDKSLPLAAFMEDSAFLP